MTEHRRGIVASACAIFVILGCMRGICAEERDSPELEIALDSGPVIGTERNGVRVWLGVPYASPPVGELRWKPPRPNKKWQMPRKADQFGASCAQDLPLGFFAAPSLAEDCLYLNVYAPPSGKLRKGAPVMVWIFGGGFMAGSANDYDPTSLVRHGVIVVTVSYRLGVLGTFLNPALGLDNASANYGLLDQIFALQWVKRNIVRFGGNPRQVTIFGESAGASSVAYLLTSPAAKGLFNGAIIESLHYESTHVGLKDGLAISRAFASEAGCKFEDIACLRVLSIQTILKAEDRTPVPPGSHIVGSHFVPMTGGPDLPEPVQVALQRGHINAVPILIGWNHDERNWRMALSEVDSGKRATKDDYLKSIQQFASRDQVNPVATASAISSAYPLSSFSVPALAISRIETDAYFVCGTRRFLRDASGKAPVWAYEFDVPDSPQYNPLPSFPVGSSHTSEIQFLFEGFHGATGQINPLSLPQKRLADQMQQFWTNLATSGNPGQGRPAAYWPTVDDRGLPVMVLSTTGSHVNADAYADHHCELWDRIGEWPRR